VITEFRLIRNFDAVDDAIAQTDLRIGIGFAEGKDERAKVEVDIVPRGWRNLVSATSNQLRPEVPY